MKNLADYIMVMDDVLPQDLCDSLIEKFEQCKDRVLTENYWENGQARRFEEINITKHQSFKKEAEIFYELTKKIYSFYREKCQINFLPSQIGYEAARMKRYEVNQKDRFDWHTDVGDYSSAKRFLVMFYYLNDVAEGGETLFNDVADRPEDEIKVNPKRGRIVIFPPMWMYPHKGCMPISNPKYIISTYCHYL